MNFKKTKELIERRICDLNIPYFSCLIHRNGSEVFRYSTSKDNKKLCMYSMIKPITCVAFMQLVEKGLVDLNDNVSKYLEGFNCLKNINTGEFYSKDITIKHLLTMTSGLDYNFQRPSILKIGLENPGANTIEICQTFALDGLIFEPGTNYEYSLSIDVVAAIIEKITNCKFSNYIKCNIFDVLGMNDSTAKKNNALANYCEDEYWPVSENTVKKSNSKYYFTQFPTENYESGGGGLISTIDDYIKFTDSLANNLENLITNESVDTIAKIYVENPPYDEGNFQFSKSNKDYGYGLAVRVRKAESPEGIPYGEFGWDGATGSYCLIDRKNHLSIVMGLTIGNWPCYLKDFHISIVKQIYRDLLSK